MTDSNAAPTLARKILDALPGSPAPDVTTLDPSSLDLVGDFIDGKAVVA